MNVLMPTLKKCKKRLCIRIIKQLIIPVKRTSLGGIEKNLILNS